MSTDLDSLMRMVANWGVWAYVFIAVLVMVEGPTFTLLAGVAASTGRISALLVFLVAAGGNLTGDTLWYSLGRLGRREWILRHGRWLGVRAEHIARLERVIRERAVRLLVTAKLTLGLMVPTLIAAGLARVPWRRSFKYLALAEIVWTGTLVGLGYGFGQSIQHLTQGFQFAAIGGSAIMVFLIGYTVARGLAAEPVPPSDPFEPEQP